MKKLFYISLIALTALVACKKERSSVEPTVSNHPSWLENEDLQVPVLFSSGDVAETKAGPILPEDFYNTTTPLYYGITAYDTNPNNTGEKLFKTTGNYAIATNVENADLSGLSQTSYMAQFVDPADLTQPVTYYYPLASRDPQSAESNNFYMFDFFGYRTNDDDNFALTWSGTNATITGIVIGHQDVLWGYATAPALTPTPGNNVYGFNAKYIREAYKYVNYVSPTFYDNWAPKMHFLHLTSAFQIIIKTDPGRGTFGAPGYDVDAAAKKFENADIYIKSISLSGVHTAATLNVTVTDAIDSYDANRIPTAFSVEKLLEFEGSANTKANTTLKATEVVNPTVNRGGQETTLAHFYPQFNWDGETPGAEGIAAHGQGNPFGEPFLVLPTIVEQGGDSSVAFPTIYAHITFNIPGQEDYVSDVELKYPVVSSVAQPFEPGKKYIFTILVHAPEEIEVVTSLAGWTDVIVDQIEIE